LRTTSAAEIADTQFFVRPGVAVENITVADAELGMGFTPAALRITRTDGPRWSHDVDTHLHSITAGLNPHGLPLGEVVELYCAAKQLDAHAMMPTVIAAIVDLVRHGVVLPTVLMEN
ncbi:MAG: rRNA methyltransferase, partial [Corynebacterium sp.]|nr:rRNA methyltransferase [Corynebacterium sp.]